MDRARKYAGITADILIFRYLVLVREEKMLIPLVADTILSRIILIRNLLTFATQPRSSSYISLRTSDRCCTTYTIS
jgi:hypothetical protein